MKDQSFANLNLATGIPSIYMCVNMNIKKKLEPAKQLQLTFYVLFIFYPQVRIWIQEKEA